MVGVSTSRDWESTGIAPFEDVEDVSRGELRLAAEVVVSVLSGAMTLPKAVIERGMDTLRRVARD